MDADAVAPAGGSDREPGEVVMLGREVAEQRPVGALTKEQVATLTLYCTPRALAFVLAAVDDGVAGAIHRYVEPVPEQHLDWADDDEEPAEPDGPRMPAQVLSEDIGVWSEQDHPCTLVKSDRLVVKTKDVIRTKVAVLELVLAANRAHNAFKNRADSPAPEAEPEKRSARSLLDDLRKDLPDAQMKAAIAELINGSGSDRIYDLLVGPGLMAQRASARASATRTRTTGDAARGLRDAQGSTSRPPARNLMDEYAAMEDHDKAARWQARLAGIPGADVVDGRGAPTPIRGSGDKALWSQLKELKFERETPVMSVDDFTALVTKAHTLFFDGDTRDTLRYMMGCTTGPALAAMEATVVTHGKATWQAFAEEFKACYRRDTLYSQRAAEDLRYDVRRGVTKLVFALQADAAVQGIDEEAQKKMVKNNLLQALRSNSQMLTAMASWSDADRASLESVMRRAHATEGAIKATIEATVQRRWADAGARRDRPAQSELRERAYGTQDEDDDTITAREAELMRLGAADYVSDDNSDEDGRDRWTAASSGAMPEQA